MPYRSPLLPAVYFVLASAAANGSELIRLLITFDRSCRWLLGCQVHHFSYTPESVELLERPSRGCPAVIPRARRAQIRRC